MGGKHSVNEGGARPRTYSNAGEAGGQGVVTSNGAGGLAVPGTSSSSGMSQRGRTRSLGSVTQQAHSHGRPLSIPSNGASALASGSPDSDSSASEDNATVLTRSFLQHSSLPVHLFTFHTGFKCPVCSKVVPPEETECHLVICLTKPRISYNEDVLTEDKGECVICLDDLQQGDTIARLPCLCIYHKTCIDDWFKVNRSCPEHPGD